MMYDPTEKICMKFADENADKQVAIQDLIQEHLTVAEKESLLDWLKIEIEEANESA